MLKIFHKSFITKYLPQHLYFYTKSLQRIVDCKNNAPLKIHEAVAEPGFPRGGANPRRGANLLFGQFFPKSP